MASVKHQPTFNIERSGCRDDAHIILSRALVATLVRDLSLLEHDYAVVHHLNTLRHGLVTNSGGREIICQKFVLVNHLKRIG